MEGREGLAPEQKLVLLLSRATFSQADESELREAVGNTSLDWYAIHNMAIKNRVLPLLWKNVYDRNYEDYMPRRLQEMAQLIYLGTGERNRVYLAQLEEVLTAFQAAGIPVSPLKGGYLIQHVYGDLGVRSVNDMDCMIDFEDRARVDELMRSLGYIQGELDRSDGLIKPISRARQIKWRTMMSNLYPYQKQSPSPYLREVSFDFCFSFERQTGPVQHMISRLEQETASPHPVLRPSDFFTHLCCHLYKEANHAAWIVFEKDINLIKFCDVREYVLRKMSREELLEAVAFAREYGLEKALFFTLFYLQQIYDDGYEQALMDAIGIGDDLQWLHTYGTSDFGEARTWKKSFWARLFASDNKEELESMPHFFES
ncbi:hypothetical protein PA598K_03410 [Paenibacillus sp. 598K]|uniref:nucleotidyltransferase domain-containing protein n=1 Tax=Paenibacillus sp. 598K TaxID=1117987 RepID=UPI000FFB0342|nr:nucleotidyltransferase family protein [Paenibacillus sp. 598K]GBF75031.1 hypothetical protein PA598K_03410 [Paenibacillus sp. 598K]